MDQREIKKPPKARKAALPQFVCSTARYLGEGSTFG